MLRDVSLIKMDINEFYVAGEAHRIAEHVSRLFTSDGRSLMFDVLFYLLTNQYVSHDGITYRVNTGCGIVHHLFLNIC